MAVGLGQVYQDVDVGLWQVYLDVAVGLGQVYLDVAVGLGQVQYRSDARYNEHAFAFVSAFERGRLHAHVPFDRANAFSWPPKRVRLNAQTRSFTLHLSGTVYQDVDVGLGQVYLDVAVGLGQVYLDVAVGLGQVYLDVAVACGFFHLSLSSNQHGHHLYSSCFAINRRRNHFLLLWLILLLCAGL